MYCNAFARLSLVLLVLTAGCSTEVTTNSRYWNGDQPTDHAWIPGHDYRLTTAAALAQVQGRDDLPAQLLPNRAGDAIGTVAGYESTKPRVITQRVLAGTRVKVTKLVKRYDPLTGLESLNVEGRVIDGPSAGITVSLNDLSTCKPSDTLSIPTLDPQYVEAADNGPAPSASTTSFQIPATELSGFVGIPYP